MSTSSHRRSLPRLALELSLCTGIAVAAHRARAAGVPAPVATMTLFGAMGAASLARRVAPSHARSIQYGTPLSLGLILLGVQLKPHDLSALGPTAPAWILGYQLTVAITLCWVLRSQGFCPRSRGLLCMGLSGAGLASVLAVTRADPGAPKDITPLVLSGILTTGALGFLVLPVMGQAFDLGAPALSCWVGICMPTTAEAVLIGAAHSDEALRLTAGWRLLVNGLQWIPIAAYLAIFSQGDSRPGGRLARGLSIGATTMRGIPLFVWGLMVVGGMGYAQYFDPAERKALGALTYWSLLVALAGIGWNTRPKDFMRHGTANIAILLAVWLFCVSLLLLAVVGTLPE